MKWKKWGEYAIQSDNFKYSVSKSMVKGEWIFEAWLVSGQHCIGRFKTSKEGIERCKEHEK